ncbi:emp24/gp25L/p24 family of membrane trafficking protein [Handroanthus impetiginosus]|uniref:Emp24/gp25L/p24 family of membrane trafficking protein n=1 Tax=Handroanthus impetiginosus TaxID=429701 RepID=A0A2G9HRB3_9LAMI|nr:emp24/gp25L/p24 family of membrane trafficking protein [Handroanthus impetiginosus]
MVMGADAIMRAVLLLVLLCVLQRSEAIWLNLPASGTKCVSEDIQNNVVVVADYVVISNDVVNPNPTISAKVTSPYGNTLHQKENVSHGQFAFTTTEGGNYLACFWVDSHSPRGGDVSVNLDWKTGIAARDWESVAKKEKIEVTSPYGNTLHQKENVSHGQFAFTTTEGGNYLACFWVDSHSPRGGDVSVNLDWKTGIAARDWESVAKKEKIEGIELELRKLEGAVEAIHENLLYLKSREADMRIVSETTNARVAWFSIMSLGVCILVSIAQIWHLKRYFHKKKLI